MKKRKVYETLNIKKWNGYAHTKSWFGFLVAIGFSEKEIQDMGCKPKMLKELSTKD
jgi:hypothetical protein